MQFATKQLSCKFTNSTRLNIEHAKFQNWTKREKRIKFLEQERERRRFTKFFFFNRKNDKKKEKEEKKQDMNEKPGATRGKI